MDKHSSDNLSQPTNATTKTIAGQQHFGAVEGAASSNGSGASDLWCPIIFDGWRCWPSTRAGDTAYVSCPSNHPGFSAERKSINNNSNQ